MNDLQLILTSTVTATVTASLITGGLALLGQRWERETRRKEIILKAALEAGRSRIANILEIIKLTGAKGNMPDEIILTGTYYKWLKHLDEKGELPKEAIEAEQASAKKLQEAKEERKKEIRKATDRVIKLSQNNPVYARGVLAQANQFAFTQEEIESLSTIAMQGYC